MLYDDLTRESGHYQAYKESWETLKAFELGLPALSLDYPRYCPKRSSETPEQYQDRLRSFSYTPVLITEIRELVDRLVANPLVETGKRLPYADRWAKDTDGNQTSRDDLIDLSLTTALLYGAVYWGSEVPPTIAEDALEEEQDTLKTLVFSPLHVIRESEEGYVTREWIETASLEGTVTKKQRIILWGKQATTVYEIPEVGSDPKGDLFPVSIGSGNRMQVFKVPLKQTVGLTCLLKQLQHTRIENSWTHNAVIAGQVQRIYTPVAVQADDPRVISETHDYSKYGFDGSGVLVGGGYQVVEAEGKALSNLQAALDKIEKQIKTLVSKAFATGTGNLEQSGLSKSIDQLALNDSLRSLGVKFCAAWTRLVVSQEILMGGTGDLSVSGMSDYSVDSLEEMLQKTEIIMGLAEFLSPECLEKWIARLQSAMNPGMAQEDLEAMNAGIPKWEPDTGADQDLQAIADSLGLSIEEVQAVLGG